MKTAREKKKTKHRKKKQMVKNNWNDIEEFSRNHIFLQTSTIYNILLKFYMILCNSWTTCQPASQSARLLFFWTLFLEYLNIDTFRAFPSEMLLSGRVCVKSVGLYMLIPDLISSCIFKLSSLICIPLLHGLLLRF